MWGAAGYGFHSKEILLTVTEDDCGMGDTGRAGSSEQAVAGLGNCGGLGPGVGHGDGEK